jgi:threonine/homoserine/homoserine lactone efflux protein
MLDTLFAMDPVTIMTFMGAGILLNLTPGADVIFVSACGMQGGWRVGIAAALGITSGSILHITLAAIGLSALLLTVPHAYDAMRYLGAAYLAYLAYKSWSASPDLMSGKGAGSMARALKRGFLTNALNPKVALFILAFLPQFTNPAIGPVWEQIVVLGGIFTLTGLVITSGYGAGAGVFGTALRSHTQVMNKLTALVFGGLAARLVFD